MEFALNGTKVVVDANDAAKMTLNEYIRFKTKLKVVLAISAFSWRSRAFLFPRP
jgi:hypothetical protein